MKDATLTLVQALGERLDLRAEGEPPPPGALLAVERAGPPLLAEAVGPLAGGRVRALALEEPEGLRVGARARVEPPWSVPAGEATRGRIMDLLGRPLDEGPPLEAPPAPVLAPAPGPAPVETLGWGHGPLDWLCPLPRGGLVAMLDLDGAGLPALLARALARGWTPVVAAVALGAAELLALRGPGVALHAAPAAAPAAARARLPLAAAANAAALARAGHEVALVIADVAALVDAQDQAATLAGPGLSWASTPLLGGQRPGPGAVTVFEVQRARPRRAPLAAGEAGARLSWDATGPRRSSLRGGGPWEPPDQAALRRRARALLDADPASLHPADAALALDLARALDDPAAPGLPALLAAWAAPLGRARL